MIEEHDVKIDKETIKVIESFIESKFPQDYKEFLLKYNGGFPKKNIFNLNITSMLGNFYIVNSLKNWTDFIEAYKIHKNRIPKEFITIGSDVGGNEILLGIKDKYRGKIYFWDHEEEVEDDEEPDFRNMTFLSNSFTEFVDSLVVDIEE